MHVGDQVRKVLRDRRALTQKLNREPTNDEIAAEVGITPKKVGDLLELVAHPVSLETPVGDGESIYADLIEDERAASPDAVTTETARDNELEAALAQLEPGCGTCSSAATASTARRRRRSRSSAPTSASPASASASSRTRRSASSGARRRRSSSTCRSDGFAHGEAGNASCMRTEEQISVRQAHRPGTSGETPKEKTDRQLIELLNELRVALPGAQVLLAFLLAVPFATRFDKVEHATAWRCSSASC